MYALEQDVNTAHRYWLHDAGSPNLSDAPGVCRTMIFSSRDPNATIGFGDVVFSFERRRLVRAYEILERVSPTFAASPSSWGAVFLVAIMDVNVGAVLPQALRDALAQRVDECLEDDADIIGAARPFLFAQTGELLAAIQPSDESWWLREAGYVKPEYRL